MFNQYKKHGDFQNSGRPRIYPLLILLLCLFYLSTNAFSIEDGHENFEFELNRVEHTSSETGRSSRFHALLNIDSFYPKEFLYNVTFGYFSRLTLLDDWRIFKIIAPIRHEIGEKIDIFFKPHPKAFLIPDDHAFGEDMAAFYIFSFRNGSACFLLRSLSDDGSPDSDILPTCVGIGIKWTFY